MYMNQLLTPIPRVIYCPPSTRGHTPTLTPGPNYYDVLGLPRHASEQEVIKAWRKAVLLHHPDKQASTQAAVKPRDGVDIRLINEAKWVLSDSQRREEWEEAFFSTGMFYYRIAESCI